MKKSINDNKKEYFHSNTAFLHYFIHEITLFVDFSLPLQIILHHKINWLYLDNFLKISLRK